MNEFAKNNCFDWGAFIAGILMIITAFLLIWHPNSGLHAFVLIFGIVAIIQGIEWLAAYFRIHNYYSHSWVTIISVILDIIIGVLFLCSYDIGELTITYLFVIWFFVDSLVGIVFSGHLRSISTGYFIFNLILNIISLGVAVLLIFNPIIAALSLVWLVAFWLVIFGINEVVVAWMHR